MWSKCNNLKPCRSWNSNFHQNKNHPKKVANHLMVYNINQHHPKVNTVQANMDIETTRGYCSHMSILSCMCKQMCIVLTYNNYTQTPAYGATIGGGGYRAGHRLHHMPALHQSYIYTASTISWGGCEVGSVVYINTFILLSQLPYLTTCSVSPSPRMIEHWPVFFVCFLISLLLVLKPFTAPVANIPNPLVHLYWLYYDYHLGCPARHCGVLAASEYVFYWWKNPLFRKATEVLRSNLVKRFE